MLHFPSFYDFCLPLVQSSSFACLTILKYAYYCVVYNMYLFETYLNIECHWYQCVHFLKNW